MQNKSTSNGDLLVRSCQKGFTLLEVLVAVMILGLTLTALLQQFSVAQRAGIKSRDVTEAVMLAKEKLEEIKIEKDLSESTESGTFDNGYEWETIITPYTYEEEGDEESYEELKYETFQLQSKVKWHIDEDGRGKEFELTTLKTVRKKKWN